MIVLNDQEVNPDNIAKRFEKLDKKSHEINIGYPDINPELTLEEVLRISDLEWNIINKKILEDYKDKNYDLIVVHTPYCKNIISRIFCCFTEAYIFR
jgi:hypothetical protein